MAIINLAKQKILQGDINLVSDTLKAALLTDAHSTDINANEFFSDININESEGIGYTTGGMVLSFKSVIINESTNAAIFDADDVTWPLSTITARYLVLYKDTGQASTSPLIAIVDFGSNQSSSDSSFTIQWNTNGVLNLT